MGCSYSTKAPITNDSQPPTTPKANSDDSEDFTVSPKIIRADSSPLKDPWEVALSRFSTVPEFGLMNARYFVQQIVDTAKSPFENTEEQLGKEKPVVAQSLENSKQEIEKNRFRLRDYILPLIPQCRAEVSQPSGTDEVMRLAEIVVSGSFLICKPSQTKDSEGGGDANADFGVDFSQTVEFLKSSFSGSFIGTQDVAEDSNLEVQLSLITDEIE